MNVPILHVALHLSLCSAITKKAAETPVAIHVRLLDQQNHTNFEKTFTVTRGYEDTRVVEFDTERGTYHLFVDVPKFHCSANDYPTFMVDVNRNSMSETLVPGVAPDLHPMLLSGSIPQSFVGEEPQFVFFDKATTGCNKPVGDVLPGNVKIDYDQEAYYASIFPDPAIEAKDSVYMALRLRTPQKEYHYIRIPMPYPVPWYGWPSIIRMNLAEEELTQLSHDPIDTLLCPKFLKTSIG